MRKFNHYVIFKIVAIGYITFASLGILGLIFNLLSGVSGDFGIY